MSDLQEPLLASGDDAPRLEENVLASSPRTPPPLQRRATVRLTPRPELGDDYDADPHADDDLLFDEDDLASVASVDRVSVLTESMRRKAYRNPIQNMISQAVALVAVAWIVGVVIASVVVSEKYGELDEEEGEQEGDADGDHHEPDHSDQDGEGHSGHSDSDGDGGSSSGETDGFYLVSNLRLSADDRLASALLAGLRSALSSRHHASLLVLSGDAGPGAWLDALPDQLRGRVVPVLSHARASDTAKWRRHMADLPDDAFAQLQQNGFFAMGISSHLRLLSLDTARPHDKRQLAWLRDELIAARDARSQVLVFGATSPFRSGSSRSPLAETLQSPMARGVVASALFSDAGQDQLRVVAGSVVEVQSPPASQYAFRHVALDPEQRSIGVITQWESDEGAPSAWSAAYSLQHPRLRHNT